MKKKKQLNLRKKKISKLSNLRLIVGGTVTEGTHDTDDVTLPTDGGDSTISNKSTTGVDYTD